jgi:hypothetical protein
MGKKRKGEQNRGLGEERKEMIGRGGKGIELKRKKEKMGIEGREENRRREEYSI